MPLCNRSCCRKNKESCRQPFHIIECDVGFEAIEKTVYWELMNPGQQDSTCFDFKSSAVCDALKYESYNDALYTF
jgi:hypothetical protein